MKEIEAMLILVAMINREAISLLLTERGEGLLTDTVLSKCVNLTDKGCIKSILMFKSSGQFLLNINKNKTPQKYFQV